MKGHDNLSLEPSLLQLCFIFPKQIPTLPNSVPIFFPRDTVLVPLPAHFCLILYFDQEVLIEPCCSWIFLVQINTRGDRELLCSKKNVFKELTALFSFIVPGGCFPGGFINGCLKQKVCFPKTQHPDFPLHMAHIPQDSEFHQDIMTTAQAATSLDIPN